MRVANVIPLGRSLPLTGWHCKSSRNTEGKTNMQQPKSGKKQTVLKSVLPKRSMQLPWPQRRRMVLILLYQPTLSSNMQLPWPQRRRMVLFPLYQPTLSSNMQLPWPQIRRMVLFPLYQLGSSRQFRSSMLLDPTPAGLKLLLACDQ
jgi:hypothetical protein